MESGSGHVYIHMCVYMYVYIRDITAIQNRASSLESLFFSACPRLHNLVTSGNALRLNMRRASGGPYAPWHETILYHKPLYRGAPISIILIIGAPNKVSPAFGNPKPYKPLYNPCFHFIVHFVFHLILHCCGMR